MFKNYVKIGWRNLLKNKAYSSINIGGLALGMAVTLIIGLWIEDELTHNDYFNHYDRIAQVYQSQTFNGQTGTGPAIPRPLENALREGYGDNFEHLLMCSWTSSLYLKYGETNISRAGNYIQRQGPELLELNVTKGEKDGLREINSIMLSESTAEALFGNQDPIGKVVKASNQYDLMVTAVYEDIPVNNSFNDTDYLIPWEHYVSVREWVQLAEDNWGKQLFSAVCQNC